ncbi:hypothetical protein GCM10028868_18050 [Virgibacillus kimchii]
MKKIKMLCDEKNITFAELERKIGISNGQIRRWDNSSPKLENVKKVADYFKVSLDYLTGFDEELGEFKKAETLDDLIALFADNDFEIDIKDNDGVETVQINHFDHGTVESIDLYYFMEYGERILEKLKEKYNINDVHTIAAHHEGEDWTEEELEEIERFKEFVRMKRKQQE